MRDNNLYRRVDRIQSGESFKDTSHPYYHIPKEIKHRSTVYHDGGKSNKDLFLEQKAEALRLELRL